MNFILGVIVGYILAIVVLSSGVKNFQEICQNLLTNPFLCGIIYIERGKEKRGKLK